MQAKYENCDFIDTPLNINQRNFNKQQKKKCKISPEQE